MTGRRLQLYAHGESLGGGYVTSMCLKEPALVDGVVLVAPMVAIAEEILPHPAVLWLFEHLVVHLLPTAKIMPTKDIGRVAFSDAAVLEVVEKNPLGMLGEQLRVRTAYSLITACRAMVSRLHEFRTPFIVLHARHDKVSLPRPPRSSLPLMPASPPSMPAPLLPSLHAASSTLRARLDLGPGTTGAARPA